MAQGLLELSDFLATHFPEVLAGLADGEEVKVDGELLNVAVEPLHLPVLENQRVIFLLFLNVVLHVDRVFKDLSRDVELSSISLQELPLVAGNPVEEALKVRSCYGDFARLRHEVNQSKQMLIHPTQ